MCRCDCHEFGRRESSPLPREQHGPSHWVSGETVLVLGSVTSVQWIDSEVTDEPTSPVLRLIHVPATAMQWPLVLASLIKTWNSSNFTQLVRAIHFQVFLHS